MLSMGCMSQILVVRRSRKGLLRAGGAKDKSV
jgi:hypothetical protein